MDHKDPPEFILDVFADPRSLGDVVSGILHTIFFNRFFPSLAPQTRDVLGITLPYVDDEEVQTMIAQRAAALERQLDAQRSSGVPDNDNGGGRGQVAVQFFEKRRRKAWLPRGDEEVCWECWTIKVTVAEPKTESGK
jgi:autophagy-related protein 101